jgi:hypothetical protein
MYKTVLFRSRSVPDLESSTANEANQEMELKVLRTRFAAILFPSLQIASAAPNVHVLSAINTGDKFTASCQQISDLPSLGAIEILSGYEIYSFSNSDCIGWTKNTSGLVMIDDISANQAPAQSYILATAQPDLTARAPPGTQWYVMKVCTEASLQGLCQSFTTSQTTTCQNVAADIAEKAASIFLPYVTKVALLHTDIDCGSANAI